MGGILWTYPKKSQPKSNIKAESYYTSLVSNELTNGDSPKEQVQLNLSLSDASFKSQYLITILLSEGQEGLRVIGMTNEEQGQFSETVIKFNSSFILDYFFEKEQIIVFNIRKNNKSFSVNTSLGNIMGSRGQVMVKEISPNDSHNKEKIIIEANTLKNNNINVSMDFIVESPLNYNNSLFFIIKKERPDNVNNNQNTFRSNGEEIEYFNVYKSEVQVLKNGKALFNNIKIPSPILCNGEFENPILIEFHSYTEHTTIGCYKTTVDKFLYCDSQFILKGTEILTVSVKCKLLKEHTFLDYLKGGMQIALNIGIDFTGSNGNPSELHSLHFIDPHSPNSYEKALRACGDILAYYDYDQMFPVYGYGALVNGRLSHCFPLNFNYEDHNINTIDGVLECYRRTLKCIQLSGPTHFAPLIQQFIQNIRAESTSDKMVYHILLILTDGMINDMDNTIDALVEASFMPASVIIVGIGKNDFSNMDILDADENPLIDRRGRKAARDLVQFVPFYKFQNDGKALAAQVLEEIPRQVVEYYKMINKPPCDPVVFN